MHILNKIKHTAVFILPLIVFPVAVSAQYFGEVDTFFTRISGFIDNILIPLIFTFALLVFLWGMFKYFILGGSSDDERAKGRKLIIWAIIGFVLMVSIWGIVNIISDGLFGASAGTPKIPGTPTL